MNSRRRALTSTHFCPILLLAALAQGAVAQTGDRSVREGGAVISGVVHDSIARVPLAGATVQLVAADPQAKVGRTAVSDSLGRFSLAAVPDGRYMLGFYHPVLDSLGVEPPLREVRVEGHPVRADLGIPSAARLRGAICGGQADSSGIVVGVVRDARDGSPVAGASVAGEWVEFSLSAAGMVRRVPRLVATTKESGWFALCGVPNAGTIALVASRGADSTDQLELPMPADGFLRGELYLGASRTVVMGDTTRTDSLAPAPRRMHVGEGRLSGTVVATADARPLAGAQVGINNGPQTRANERGEWTLGNLPVGTRMLEVRAVGYYPDRRPVQVVPDAASVRVTLSTLKAVLDTVKVTAARLGERPMSGFQERVRTGVGRYLTASDIGKRAIVNASDVFRAMPGVRVENDTILMRGAFAVGGPGASMGWCQPTFFFNGLRLDSIGASDIDDWAKPDQLAGLEVYPSGTVPAQFQVGLSGCGAIVLWSK
jgi:hypothetical protein